MRRWKRYLWLCAVNLLISAFTFGGGYVVIPMVRRYFVQRAGLLREEELTDMAAIAQSAPGAIAVNLTVLAGYRVAGLPGAVLSCVSALIPPIITLSVVSLCYDAFRANMLVAAVLHGMEAGVAALIVDLIIDLYAAILREKKAILSLLTPLSFAASFYFGVGALWILLGCCAVCVCAGALAKARGKERGETA